MQSTTENIVKQPPSGWLTNQQTGKSYRPDNDYGYVSARRQKNLSVRFQDIRKRQKARANEMLKPGNAGDRLLKRCNGELWHYTLSAKDLSLSKSLERCEALFNPATVEIWLRAISKAFGTAPYFWRLEIGRDGRVHAHLLSSKNAGLPHLIRGSEKCKPVRAGDEAKELAYLLKRIPPTPENIRAYQRAVQRLGGEQHLPQTSGYRNCRLPKPPASTTVIGPPSPSYRTKKQPSNA